LWVGLDLEGAMSKPLTLAEEVDLFHGDFHRTYGVPLETCTQLVCRLWAALTDAHLKVGLLETRGHGGDVRLVLTAVPMSLLHVFGGFVLEVAAACIWIHKRTDGWVRVMWSWSTKREWPAPEGR